MDNPPVDLHHLRRYTLGNAALDAEILGLFAANLPQCLQALRSAATAKDWKMAAHTLKGSARAVGAWRVATAAEEAERLSDTRDHPACRSAVASVENAADEVLAFLDTLGVATPGLATTAA